MTYRIGLLGGMGWLSTMEYYRLLNEGTHRLLGRAHSAEIVLRSFDFQPLLDRAGDVAALERVFAETGRELVEAGATHLAVASITGHLFAGPLARRTDAAFLHIGAATSPAVAGAARVGVLGTAHTMASAELVAALTAGTAAVLPDQASWASVTAVIVDELTGQGLSHRGRAVLDAAITDLLRQGADALLLACTELAPALAGWPIEIPIYDATTLHCAAILEAVHGPG